MRRTLIKTVAVISISLALSSCSTIADKVVDAVVPGGDSGIDVTANVGKVEAEKGSAQQGEVNLAVAPIEETNYSAPIDTVVNESGLKWWEFAALILLAGWAIPSPAEMLEGIIRAVLRPLAAVRRNRDEPPTHL